MENLEIEEYKSVNGFLFTSKTISYNGKTIQLNNVPRIEKYSLKETIYANYSISDSLYSNSVIGIIVGFILLFIPFFGLIVGGIILIMSIIIRVRGYLERKKRKDEDVYHYGLIIETSSGRIENLLSDDFEFITKLFDNITISMNSEDSTIIQANFDNKNINVEHIYGDKVNGDKFKDIYNSTINNRSTVNQ